MAQDLQEAPAAEPVANKRISAGVRVMGWLTTTDHKVIGNLYMVTAFGFFLLGGVLAMLMRAELAR
ncbi:cytochrome ubiquinol oxidase subunit I, partial [Streptomyces sp. NPDC005500]